MSGFLSAYSGTERIYLLDPDGSKTEYWVEIRKTLLAGDKEHAERALMNGQLDPTAGGARIEMDTVAYRQEMLLASIVAWNLDDEDGKVWPVTLSNVKRLPGIEFDRVYNEINKLNEPATKAERRDFRPEGERGDSDGDNRERHAVIPGHVLARSGNMEASGSQA